MAPLSTRSGQEHGVCHRRLLSPMFSAASQSLPRLPSFPLSLSPGSPPRSGCPLDASSSYMLISIHTSAPSCSVAHPVLLKSLSTSLSFFKISTGFPGAHRICPEPGGHMRPGLFLPVQSSPLTLCSPCSGFLTGPRIYPQACAPAVVCLRCLPSVPLLSP